ncbi:MAG: 6-phosphogluconolactonase [Candidatus Pacebacteria bacterium]|nr:6-phosphogluconolactonase [Candidatus Paceibacterota bacterium]
MERNFEKNENILKERAGEKLSHLFSEKIPTLLLLAGGSAFSFLDFVDSKVFSSNLTIGMGDERYSIDENINNFSQLQKTQFFADATKGGVQFFDSRVETDETFEQFGERFRKNIEDWILKNPEGNIIAILGIGEDGHTAGILPFAENPDLFDKLFEQNEIAVAYDAKGKNLYPHRVTITLPFIRSKIQKSIVYATGEKKRQALGKIFAPAGHLSETPARILKEMKHVILFSDIEA